MIVVNLDDVFVFLVLYNFVGKCLIYIDVVFLWMVFVSFVFWIVWDLIVKYGLKDLFVEVGVMIIEVFIGVEYG